MKILEPSEKQGMVVEYWPWVRIIARRMRKGLVLDGSADVDDLISDGVIGLMDAIDRFDSDRGVKFKTYAAPRIFGAIVEGLRERDWVPKYQRQRNFKAPYMLPIHKQRFDDDCAGQREVLTASHPGLEPMQQMANREECDRLVAPLKRSHRLAMRLTFAENMSRAEVGKVLGFSPSFVSQMLKESAEQLGFVLPVTKINPATKSMRIPKRLQ